MQRDQASWQGSSPLPDRPALERVLRVSGVVPEANSNSSQVAPRFQRPLQLQIVLGQVPQIAFNGPLQLQMPSPAVQPTAQRTQTSRTPRHHSTPTTPAPTEGVPVLWTVRGQR